MIGQAVGRSVATARLQALREQAVGVLEHDAARASGELQLQALLRLGGSREVTLRPVLAEAPGTSKGAVQAAAAAALGPLGSRKARWAKVVIAEGQTAAIELTLRPLPKRKLWAVVVGRIAIGVVWLALTAGAPELLRMSSCTHCAADLALTTTSPVLGGPAAPRRRGHRAPRKAREAPGAPAPSPAPAAAS